MAIELNTGQDIGFLEAAADYQTTSKQYYFVSAASGKATLASSAGQACIGVLQNDPAAGQPAIVRTGGVSKVLVGTGDLAANAQVQTNANGEAIAAASGDYSLGTCLIGASAGEYATILVGGSTGQVN